MPLTSPFILMSADALGGVWQYTLDLASGLGRRGARVGIALMGPPPAAEVIAHAEAESGARILATGLPLDWTASSAAEVERASASLARLAWAGSADLVHLHSPALALASYPAPVVAVCHSCVATWWASVNSGPLPADLAWRRDLAAEGCLRADSLIAPTHAFARATQAAYGLRQPPAVVRNGRRAPAIPGDAETAAHVFTAGRLWDPAKNAAALDRMAARLSLPVLAAGPVAGPTGQQVAPHTLRLLGRLDEAGMARELARQPIFVSLARYEPFGLAVLEAAQAGCALVLSDIESFRELWDEAALFVPPDDDAAAAQAVEHLAADPARRAALGQAGQTRAAAYSVEAMVEGVTAVFRSLRPARDEAAA
ncbi:glycosyltransferase family 4 protein [Methylobacterium organophilum]|uniref:Glycogen synthase n=1 Tax=Methylobacterium organophilum TaxID=410 RepID=A0ABQ4T350_METOR|nr:glycosyltransferase family 4 protein [Methylobacterium organophilum]GJE25963.1 Glycogen synthase [Methylobacterium organophilum]